MIGKKQQSNRMSAVHDVILLQEGQLEEKIQMIANAETREVAEEIAALYGITLLNYEYKVATYETDKNPHQLIKMGQEKGYPVIEINYHMSLF